MTHSPEPWKAVELTTTDWDDFLGIEDANGERVVSSVPGVYESHAPGIADDDIQRMVECVNALQGVEDPEAFVKHVANAIKWLTKAECQSPASRTYVLEHLRKAASAAKCFGEFT